MGLNIDPAAVSDPATLIDCFDESFGALLGRLIDAARSSERPCERRSLAATGRGATKRAGTSLDRVAPFA